MNFLLKRILLFASLFFIIFGLNAKDITFNDIFGDYEVTIAALPMSNTITWSRDGRVIIVEKSPLGVVVCQGDAVIQDSIMKSKVICPNGFSFFQSVDMRDVGDFSEFYAPLFNSRYGMEIEAHFERIGENRKVGF